MVTITREEVQKYLYQQQLEETFGQFIDQITLFEGKKGKGKTLGSVATIDNLYHLFEMPIVVIGTRLGLKKDHIPFTYIDEREFVANLEGITKISKSTDEGTLRSAIESTLKTMGVNILNACLVFDECYKLFDARTPSDKLVLIFGYFIAQSRHYGTTILMTAPDRNMIDRRIRKQIDWFGRCTTTCKTLNRQCVRPNCPHLTKVRFVGGFETWRLRIYGPNYWEKYDSWAVAGFRERALKINHY